MRSLESKGHSSDSLCLGWTFLSKNAQFSKNVARHALLLLYCFIITPPDLHAFSCVCAPYMTPLFFCLCVQCRRCTKRSCRSTRTWNRYAMKAHLTLHNLGNLLTLANPLSDKDARLNFVDTVAQLLRSHLWFMSGDNQVTRRWLSQLFLLFSCSTTQTTMRRSSAASTCTTSWPTSRGSSRTSTSAAPSPGAKVPRAGFEEEGDGINARGPLHLEDERCWGWRDGGWCMKTWRSWETFPQTSPPQTPSHSLLPPPHIFCHTLWSLPPPHQTPPTLLLLLPLFFFHFLFFLPSSPSKVLLPWQQSSNAPVMS